MSPRRRRSKHPRVPHPPANTFPRTLPDPDLIDDGPAYASIADLPAADDGDVSSSPTPPTAAHVAELMSRVTVGELLPARTIGRPPIEMTSQLRRQLVALAQIHCTMAEISAVTEISHDVLTRRPEFRELILAGRARGRASLRRLQFQKAVDGNVPMLIWLGKNLLGQMDRAVLGGDNAATMPGDDIDDGAPGSGNINLGASPSDVAASDPAVTELTAAAVADELRARLDAIRRNRLASAANAEAAVARHDGAHAQPVLDADAEPPSPVIDVARALPPAPLQTQQLVTARRGYTFTPHDRARSPEFGGDNGFRPPRRGAE